MQDADGRSFTGAGGEGRGAAEHDIACSASIKVRFRVDLDETGTAGRDGGRA